jgi:hypothetical protein
MWYKMIWPWISSNGFLVKPKLTFHLLKKEGNHIQWRLTGFMSGLYQSSYSTSNQIMVEVSEDKQHGACGKKKWNWVGVLSLSFHFLLPTIIPPMFHIHIHPSTIGVTYSKCRSRSTNQTKHTPCHTFVFWKFSPQLSLSVLTLVPMGIKISLQFKEKIKAIFFYKSLKRLKVIWCTHLI